MALTPTAGYTWVNGEVVTATKLNLAANPTIPSDQSYTFAAGSNAAPSVNFTGGTTTGLYYSSGVGIAVGGVNVGIFSSTGLTMPGALVLNGLDGENLKFTKGTNTAVQTIRWEKSDGTDLGFLSVGGSGTNYIMQFGTNISGQSLLMYAGAAALVLTLSDTAATFATKIVIVTGTPASAAATGTAGTVLWDASFLYVCTATDTWKRAAISTW